MKQIVSCILSVILFTTANAGLCAVWAEDVVPAEEPSGMPEYIFDEAAFDAMLENPENSALFAEAPVVGSSYFYFLTEERKAFLSQPSNIEQYIQTKEPGLQVLDYKFIRAEFAFSDINPTYERTLWVLTTDGVRFIEFGYFGTNAPGDVLLSDKTVFRYYTSEEFKEAYQKKAADLYVLGETIPMDYCYIRHEDAMISLRSLLEGLGAKVVWDEAYNTATLLHGKYKYYLLVKDTVEDIGVYHDMTIIPYEDKALYEKFLIFFGYKDGVLDADEEVYSEIMPPYPSNFTYINDRIILNLSQAQYFINLLGFGLIIRKVEDHIEVKEPTEEIEPAIS